MRMTIILWLLSAVICVVVGLIIGYRLWHTAVDQPTAETVAAGYTQHDGSDVLPRIPMPNPPEPPHQLPAGSHELARVRVKVRPNPVLHPTKPGHEDPCPPAIVDLSLVRERDGGTRAVVSSPNGTILDGLHTPIMDTPVVSPNWVQLNLQPQHNAYGILIGRNFRLFGKQIGLGIGIDKPEIGKPHPTIGIQVPL